MPIPPQILYPLITGGVNLATQLATKPKKQKSPIDYMNKYIANLRSDIGKRETYHTMMRSNLGAIGKATSAQRREAKYLGELKGTGGGILSAEMQRIQQGQNEAISRASGQAEQAQRRETAGLQASLREAEMMREQIVQRTREANRVQDQQWQQGLIQTGLQTAGQVGMGALQYGQDQKALQQKQTQQEAIMGVYADLENKKPEDIQAGVDSGLYDADTGIEMLEAQQELRKPNVSITEVGVGNGMQQKAIVDKKTNEITLIGKPYLQYKPTAPKTDTISEWVDYATKDLGIPEKTIKGKATLKGVKDTIGEWKTYLALNRDYRDAKTGIESYDKSEEKELFETVIGNTRYVGSAIVDKEKALKTRITELANKLGVKVDFRSDWWRKYMENIEDRPERIMPTREENIDILSQPDEEKWW